MTATTMIEQQLPFDDKDEPSDWRDIDDRVSALEEKGKVTEAKRVAAGAVREARAAENGKKGNEGQLSYCLEVRANLFNRQGDYGAASEDYFEAISLMAGKSGQDGEIGRIYGNLGFLFESTNEEEKAIDAYERALEFLGRLREPSVIEEVRLSNNLAFIYSAKNDFDQAETLFLKALKLAHEKLGESDPDSTGIFNNVGALYQKAGHLDQAREMHTMALEGRLENGESSSDIGQSYGNLAIVFAEEGDEENAREHFEKAIESFQNTGPEFSEDYESVCFNYLQLLDNVGDVSSRERVESLAKAGLK